MAVYQAARHGACTARVFVACQRNENALHQTPVLGYGQHLLMSIHKQSMALSGSKGFLDND